MCNWVAMGSCMFGFETQGRSSAWQQCHRGKPWWVHLPDFSPLHHFSLAAPGAMGASKEGGAHYLAPGIFDPNSGSFLYTACSSWAARWFLFWQVNFCNSSCNCCYASGWFMQAGKLHWHKQLLTFVPESTERPPLLYPCVLKSSGSYRHGISTWQHVRKVKVEFSPAACELAATQLNTAHRGQRS